MAANYKPAVNYDLLSLVSEKARPCEPLSKDMETQTEDIWPVNTVSDRAERVVVMPLRPKAPRNRSKSIRLKFVRSAVGDLDGVELVLN